MNISTEEDGVYFYIKKKNDYKLVDIDEIYFQKVMDKYSEVIE